ncbi:MAG: hypothetical protein M3Y59_09405 [Myxococcota bacterium]|nr:hypothetical protein [Myxococcota bacterium]
MWNLRADLGGGLPSTRRRDRHGRSTEDSTSQHPFKGDIDGARLTRYLEEHQGKVSAVILTVTNGWMIRWPPRATRSSSSICR